MVGSIFVSDLFVPLDQGGCTQRKPSRNEADARKCSIFVRSYRITSNRAVEMAVRPCGTAGSEPVSDRSCRLKRSMQQLVVHWFGNASARIVCLAVRDQNLTNPYVSSQLACKKIEPICQAIPHLQAEARMWAPIPGEGEFTWQPKNSSRRKSFRPPSRSNSMLSRTALAAAAAKCSARPRPRDPGWRSSGASLRPSKMEAPRVHKEGLRASAGCLNTSRNRKP